MSREALLARTFVELADSLVDDFDVVDLLTMLADRCVEVLDVAAAGLMLRAPEGDLRLVSSSSEAMRIVELFEIQSREGPCLDCCQLGEPVLNQNLSHVRDRWPRFTAVALQQGFRAVHALPLRLRGDVIGAMNLFDTKTNTLSESDALNGQALADVATIGILQHRAVQEVNIVNDQLTYALNSRIVIEQAKGILAERSQIHMEEAFLRLRKYARDHNVQLAQVARNVIDGALLAETLEVSRHRGAVRPTHHQT